MQPISAPAPNADQAGPPGRFANQIPAETLRAMVVTPPRPRDDAPETEWEDAVQSGLDRLAALDPRDPIETMLAVLVVGAQAGVLDAYWLAFEPTTTEAPALRHRANAAALARCLTSTLRLLKQGKQLPAPPVCDWGNAAAVLCAASRQTLGRPTELPRGAKPAEAEPAEIVR